MTMFNCESETEKISRKTGRKPVSCKCEKCKSQCARCSCLGTPKDIEKIIDAGYGEKIMATDWAAGLVMKVTHEIVPMYQAKYIVGSREPGRCSFFENGLCTLHDKGLKPTEGKLSHHTIAIDNVNPKKSLSWNVAKEWLNPDNKETIERIEAKLAK